MAPASPRSLALVDTNLLLVLVVAAVDRMQITRWNRTRKYTLEDVGLLDAHLAQYSGLVVTPSVVTEVSNLTGQLADPLRSEVRRALAAVVLQAQEHYDASSQLVRDDNFTRLGLTDVAIAQAAGSTATVVTDDLPLYVTLAKAGIPVVNFTYLQAANWR